MPALARSRRQSRPEPVGPQPGGSPAEVAELTVRSIDEQREAMVSGVAQLRPFGIGLLDAAGLTLCESLSADLDLPLATTATTAGWAVRAANLVGADDRHPVVLPVVDEIEVGGLAGAALTAGTAIKVAAGAFIPEGADAVMPDAAGTVVDEAVCFTSEARHQLNLLPAGSRIVDGDQLLSNGALLTPRALGMIAEVGHDKVLVRPRPRVVVLTSGSDLVEPGLPLSTLSERYDATSVMIAAAIRETGGQVFLAGVLAPEPSAIAEAVSEQLVRADIVVLLADLDPSLLQALNRIGDVEAAAVDGFAGPIGFGTAGTDRSPLVVLPEAPVPAYLAYQLFGRPVVEKLAGQEETEPELIDTTVTLPLEGAAHLQLVLGRFTGESVRPLSVWGEPGAIELAGANAVIVLAAGMAVAAHDAVTCWLLD